MRSVHGPLAPAHGPGRCHRACGTICALPGSVLCARTEQEQDADQDGLQGGDPSVVHCHKHGGEGEEVGGIGVQARHAGQGVDDGGDGGHHGRLDDPLGGHGLEVTRVARPQHAPCCRRSVDTPASNQPLSPTSVSARGYVAVGPAAWAALTASIALANPAPSASAAAGACTPDCARRPDRHLLVMPMRSMVYMPWLLV